MKEAFERLKFRKKNQRFDFTKFKTVKLLHRFAGKQVAACSPTFDGLLSIRVESFSEQSVSRALFKFEGRNCRDKLVREEALFETKQRDYNCFSNTRMSKIFQTYSPRICSDSHLSFSRSYPIQINPWRGGDGNVRISTGISRSIEGWSKRTHEGGGIVYSNLNCFRINFILLWRLLITRQNGSLNRGCGKMDGRRGKFSG